MLAQLEGQARHQVGVAHRLLDHCGTAGVPGAAVLGRRRGPEVLAVRAGAVDRRTTRLPRQVEDVDAVDAQCRVGEIHRPGGPAGVVDVVAAERAVQRIDREHGGDGSAASVGRQSAVGLVGVDEVALVAAQRLVVLHRQRGDEVESLRLEIAEAAHQRGAVDFPALLLRHVDQGVDDQAAEIGAHDEVDDAADSVGAVDGTGPVFQNFDALDGGERNLVQVDRAPVQAVGGHPPAVEKDQGRVATLAAQVGAGGPVVATRGSVDDVRLRGQVVQAVAVDVELHDQLLGAGNALACQLGTADGLHRQRTFGLDALDARPGDGDPLVGRCLLRQCVAGQAHKHQHQRAKKELQFHRGSSRKDGARPLLRSDRAATHRHSVVAQDRSAHPG